MDPHQIETQDPDPHPYQRKKLDPDLHPHQSKLVPDPHQFADDKPKCMENEPVRELIYLIFEPSFGRIYQKQKSTVVCCCF